MNVKTKEKKYRKTLLNAGSHSAGKNNTTQCFSFVDNRPEAKQFVHLQENSNEPVQCVSLNAIKKNKDKTNKADKVKGMKSARISKNVLTVRRVDGLPTGRVRYGAGQHGAKSREQKRLKALYKRRVSGATHESEHTIGYAVLAGGHLPRGESKDAQILENIAPAYQEVKVLHRDHIGTGSSSKPDETNMNAGQYREMQRGLLAGDTDYHKSLSNRPDNPIGQSPTERTNAVSNAVQINQLGYGQQLQNRDYSGIDKTELGQANNSYREMVNGMNSVTYVKDANNADSVSVLDHSKLEMILARYVAVTGKWPQQQVIEINKLIEESESTEVLDVNKINTIIKTLGFY